MNRAVRRFSCFFSHPFCPMPTRYALAPLVLMDWRGAPLSRSKLIHRSRRLLLNCLECLSFGSRWFGRRSLAAHAREELFVLVYHVVPGVVSLNALLCPVSIGLN